MRATVVRAQHPTSARAGDVALVRASGEINGFVGGNCVEASVREYALTLDGWQGDFVVTAEAISRAAASLSPQVKDDIAFAHDQKLLAIDLNFGAAVLAEQHLVALLDGDRTDLAVLEDLAVAGGDDFAADRLLGGGVGISGIGREGGDYALDFYSDLKTLQILDGSTR